MTHTIYQTDRIRHHLPVTLIPYRLSVSTTSHHCHMVRSTIVSYPWSDLASKVAETVYPSLLRDSASVTPSEPFVVEKDGEMPEGTTPPPPILQPPPAPPMATRSTDVATQMFSSFPANVVDEQIPRTRTPEPIKVKRVKKKGTSSSAKSRRTVAE
jgi:hypothetical protein